MTYATATTAVVVNDTPFSFASFIMSVHRKTVGQGDLLGLSFRQC
jgi:hypothetical protein